MIIHFEFLIFDHLLINVAKFSGRLLRQQKQHAACVAACFSNLCFLFTSDSHSLTSTSQLWWGIRMPLRPRFLDSPQNVSAYVGESAYLPCTIQNLGDRSVSSMSDTSKQQYIKGGSV